MNPLLHLVADLDRRILNLLSLIPAEQPLLLAQPPRSFGQLRHGDEIKVGVEVPEQGARDAHERPVGVLRAATLHRGEGGLVDHHLVIAGLDEPARQVLELLPGLDEEVVLARGDLDGDAGACVAGPDV